MTRTARFLLLTIASFVATSIVLFALHAHADPVAPPPVAGAATGDGFPWAFWLGFAGVVLGALSHVFHYLGRRSKAAEALAKDVDVVDAVVGRSPGQSGYISDRALLILLAVSLAGAVAVAIGCGPRTSATLRQVERSAIDCGQAEIAPTAAKLLAGIEAIAVGVDGAPDRTALLDTLVAGAEDATACALKAAAVDLAERLTPAPGAPKVEGQETVGLERVRAYIKARGFVYASPAASSP